MKKKKSTKDSLEIKFPKSAGIDVGATLMQVCIPSSLDKDNNRAFGTNTGDLNNLAEWLMEKGITHVAMEATGVYWMPLFNILSMKGMHVVLLNAAEAKNYTARKTDVNDAEWLMILMRYGLVKPSFQIDEDYRGLRNFVRHRYSLVSQRSDCIRRIQKYMELMNIKLTETISNITGTSGIRIIEAILGGERDPRTLASLADKCSKSQSEIAASLEGNWNEELLFIMGQVYGQYKYLSQQIVVLDSQIESAMKKLCEMVIKAKDGVVVDVIRSKKKKAAKNRSSRIDFDIERLSTQIFGVNLMRIEGVNAVTVLSLMGELGGDFVRSFKDAAHFCSWCNLSPTDRISGGKILSSHIKKRKNNVGLILRQCAQTISKTKSPLGDYYRRMRAKGGGKYAVCCLAHKLANIIYTMVKTKTEYDASKVSITDKEWLERKIKHQQKLLATLKGQLEQCSLSVG